jgi:hypothetical protein
LIGSVIPAQAELAPLIRNAPSMRRQTCQRATAEVAIGGVIQPWNHPGQGTLFVKFWALWPNSNRDKVTKHWCYCSDTRGQGRPLPQKFSPSSRRRRLACGLVSPRIGVW